MADGGRLVPQESGPQAGPGHDRVRTGDRLVCANGKDRLVYASRKDRLVCANGKEMPRRLQERPAPAGTGRAAPAPVRLTRRGRLVITVAAALAIGALSVALAGAAQATGHSGALAGPGRAVTRVEVRPGQNLWSIAEAYDPDADTRFVIQDILQLNSLTSDQLQPGQVLWVPRG
ncbi:LysM peptidoglycan-binding domain-containing protein [Trebonia sp.]|uniref:LysM peptidoglycan-binding domain-containing protein n=1 Tax=Trebonia sp. TaxID=2767075 RepID=UPI002604CE92|nr:LysM peptidoglycan-binding domain-containing protein [Trebonia sp.]